MDSDSQINDQVFFSWVVDRYKAVIKGQELGFKNTFGCPKCPKGTMVFDEKKEIYYCTTPNCLSGSIKSLKAH